MVERLNKGLTAAQLDPLCALLDEATFLGASSSGGLSVALVGLASRHLSLPRTLERCRYLRRRRESALLLASH